MKSQTDNIREHLEQGEAITPLQALANYGVFRLAARIHDLRKSMNIQTREVTVNGHTFAEYFLKP